MMPVTVFYASKRAGKGIRRDCRLPCITNQRDACAKKASLFDWRLFQRMADNMAVEFERGN